ncbi:carboxypeptidase-like regulatory domain-containing protein [Nocardioides mangrovi]|nr:carboxypeptidase-like regulatory domain-containing protein [Nocardioides mangrovi]
MRGRSVAALAALVALLGALLTVGVAIPADAAKAAGYAFGTIRFPHHDSPKVKVLWFTQDWSYLGTANAAGGSYSINLDPGTYHLQFVDQRASYVTAKYAPTDVKVTVHDGSGTRKNVTMTRGAFITGTVKAHGRPAGKAKVVAANTGEQSFSTTANKKGQFAIGGLPASGYSVFSYDHRHAWVDKSTWAGNLGPGQSNNLAINLRTKAGNLRVYLYTSADGSKNRVAGHPVVTAVSKKTGQFWSVKSTGGSAVFQGLYPGRYKLVANGFGNWFAKTAAVQGGKVKPGRTAFGTFTYTKRGGWVTGNIIDGTSGTRLQKPFSSSTGAKIDLYSTEGALIGTGYSDDDGDFKVEGQLSTQSGVTLVVTPPADSGGYMIGDGYCQYDGTQVADLSITIGQESDAGAVEVPRHPGQENPDCTS